jgi:hypothetical protein
MKEEFIDFIFDRWYSNNDSLGYRDDKGVAKEAFLKGFEYGRRDAILDELARAGQEWEMDEFKVGGTS